MEYRSLNKLRGYLNPGGNSCLFSFGWEDCESLDMVKRKKEKVDPIVWPNDRARQSSEPEITV